MKGYSPEDCDNVNIKSALAAHKKWMAVQRDTLYNGKRQVATR